MPELLTQIQFFHGG